MILRLNHLNAKAATATTPHIVEALYKLVEDGHIDPAQFARLQVQLDWVQYKQNFREIVTVSRGAMGAMTGSTRKDAVMDMRIDTRQLTPDNLRAEMLRALTAADSERFLETPIHDRIPLEAFKSFRHSIAWEFNRLYWAHLGDW